MTARSEFLVTLRNVMCYHFECLLHCFKINSFIFNYFNRLFIVSTSIRLRDRACKVKLTVKKTADGCSYKENAAKHTHIIDARDKAAKERVKEALKKAKSTDKTTRELYAEALSGAPEEVVSRMPKAETIGKAIRTVRNGDYPKAPQTIAELVLPQILTNSGKF